MPILQLPSNPRSTAPGKDPGDDSTSANGRAKPMKVRTGRFGELEEHELIHLLDSLDDERSRARFRESIYISVIIWLALAWFLFYGPRVLFHVPQYRDPIALMKQHDQEINLTAPNLPRPKPPAHAMPDRKTLEQLQKQPRVTPPTPQPPQPAQQAPAPPPQEEAHNTPPPAPQPALPPAPRAAQPSVDLPAAPKPNFAQNSQSAHDALQNAMKGALGGRSTGADVGAPGSNGPLGAGVQVLSDTQGVDFSAYLRRVVSDTKRNWIPLIPEEAQPPISKRGVTWIRFTILPNGQIGSMVLEGPSGDRALDEAAWHGITSEGAYPPLPTAFHGPNLELRFGFFCNTPLPQ